MANVVGGAKAFKWEGVPEMKKLFNAFAIQLGPDGMGEARAQIKDILLKPANVIRHEARDMAPVYAGPERKGVTPGRLRDAITATKGPDDRPGVVLYVNKTLAPYAGFVERGTSKMAARPFFRPAIAAVRPTIANMIAGDIKPLIEGIANKLAYHPPK
jgi:HK97 gp10 family phage protein